MKRSDFLKKFGIGIGVIAITPVLLADIDFIKSEPKICTIGVLRHLELQSQKQYYTSSYNFDASEMMDIFTSASVE